MAARKSITPGQRFGRLVVLELNAPLVTPSGNIRPRWKCQCDCGNTSSVQASKLNNGATSSCGCGRGGKGRSWKRDHPRLYHAWRAMIARCCDPKHQLYKNYGGRGITVCARWMDFENFIIDLGDPPEGKSLDRINNGGNYEPGNCRWASQIEQQRNRRNNKWVSIFGQRMLIGQAYKILGARQATARDRIERGFYAGPPRPEVIKKGQP